MLPDNREHHFKDDKMETSKPYFRVLPFDYVNVGDGFFVTTRFNSFIYTDKNITSTLDKLKVTSNISKKDLVDDCKLSNKHIEHLCSIGVLKEYSDEPLNCNLISNLSGFNFNSYVDSTKYNNLFFSDDMSNFSNNDLLFVIEEEIEKDKINYYLEVNNPLIVAFILGSKLYISNIYDKKLGSPCPNCMLQHVLYDNSINGHNPTLSYRNIFEYISKSDISIPKKITPDNSQLGLIGFHLKKAIDDRILSFNGNCNTSESLTFNCIDLTNGVEESSLASHWEACECLEITI
jgi:McbB family protein